MKYAIIDADTKEFYPDPIYTDLERIEKKINYLQQYRLENNMPIRNYGIEVLEGERLEQHNREWKQYVSMID